MKTELCQVCYELISLYLSDITVRQARHDGAKTTYLLMDHVMKHTSFRLSGYFFLILVLSLAAAQAGDETQNGFAVIEVTSAKDYIAQHDNAVIMDVRTPAEYDMSHITGAINVDVKDDDFESMAANLDKDKTYVVHCTMNPTNGRSSRALETLHSLGFKNLYSLEGGYVAWKKAELPLSEAKN